MAATLVPDLARQAAGHDADDSFVTENIDLLRKSGLISAGVPAALGGGGADVRELCAMLHTLAQGCSSTALAFAMHTHQVAIHLALGTYRRQTCGRTAVAPDCRRKPDAGVQRRGRLGRRVRHSGQG